MLEEVLFEKPKVTLWAMTLGAKPDFELVGPEEVAVFAAMGDFASESAIEIQQATIHEVLSEFYAAEKKAFPENIKSDENGIHLIAHEDRLLNYVFSNPKLNKIKEKVLSESSGRGHGSVDDQPKFNFVIKNLTRVATLMLCGPEYIDHEQQSFRRVKPGNLFYIPKALREYGSVAKTGIESFDLYSKWVGASIPEEDARNVVPLLAKTNITSAADSREWKHGIHLGSQEYMPSVVKDDVISPISEILMNVAPKLFVKRATNYEMLGWWPSPVLFAPHNKTINEIITKKDNPKKATFMQHPITKHILEAIKYRYEPELSLLKHSHNGGPIEGYLAPMSLSCFHQMTRQRTLHQAVESIYDAAERGMIVIPPKIANSEFKEAYIEQSRSLLNIYKNMVKDGVPEQEAVGVLPHSLMVYDLMHVSGSNAYLFIGKRTCKAAQWEIRGIANDICKDIIAKNPMFETIAASQGTTYRRCPEKDGCASFAKEQKCPTFPGTNPEIFYQL